MGKLDPTRTLPNIDTDLFFFHLSRLLPFFHISLHLAAKWALIDSVLSNSNSGSRQELHQCKSPWGREQESARALWDPETSVCLVQSRSSDEYI